LNVFTATVQHGRHRNVPVRVNGLAPIRAARSATRHIRTSETGGATRLYGRRPPPLNVMSLSSAQLGAPLGDRQPITGHSQCHLNQSIFFMRAGRTHTPACLSVAPPRRLLYACAVIQRHTLCPSVVNRAVRFIVNADCSTANYVPQQRGLVSPGPPTTRHVLVLATQRATLANSAWSPFIARRNEYRPPPGKKYVHKTGGDVGYHGRANVYSTHLDFGGFSKHWGGTVGRNMGRSTPIPIFLGNILLLVLTHLSSRQLTVLANRPMSVIR